MPRQMRDPAFREDQWVRRYEPHVEPLNRLIDELGERDDAGHPPYIAAMYWGNEAPVLSLLRDPGPMAGGPKGSGFLCVENDDPSAERLWHFLAEAGIDPRDVVPWNAYPWYINAKPTRAQLAAGVDPLMRIIELMPRLQTVLLLGKDAQQAWPLLMAKHGEAIQQRGIAVFSTFHPSRQALQHRDPQVRADREEAISGTLRSVAALLRAGQELRSLVDVDVIGRPTGYSAGANEQHWKSAIRKAFAGPRFAAASRIGVDVAFRLDPSQRGNNAPDLDNLIKATIDALDGLLGPRSIKGRPQADDERIDRILATKRIARDGEEPGARIRVSVLPPEDVSPA